MASGQLEFEVSEYVETLFGRESMKHSTKQTSVRLATSSLDVVDILAEMSHRSRNQIINDALDFGLQLIREQFSPDDKARFLALAEKSITIKGDNLKPVRKSKKK